MCHVRVQGCHVHAIAQKLGALTAQGRSSMLEDTGFSFVNCKVTGSGALYLGRAWGPFSRVAIHHSLVKPSVSDKIIELNNDFTTRVSSKILRQERTGLVIARDGNIVTDLVMIMLTNRQYQSNQ